VSTPREQTWAEVERALVALRSLVAEFGTDAHCDAFDLIEHAAEAAYDEVCVYCSAKRGDNDYCVFDGSPHPWLTNLTEQEP